MFITREWLFSHQTEAGSWTRDQLEAVGVNWPPMTGWIDRIVGCQINEITQLRFESKLTRKQVKLNRRLVSHEQQ